MSVDKMHIRHCMLFHFQRGISATNATKTICDVYGKDVLNIRKCQRWFSKFRSGDFDLSDCPRSGRPTEIDQVELKALVERNPQLTTREIAEKLKTTHTTVQTHLKLIAQGWGHSNNNTEAELVESLNQGSEIDREQHWLSNMKLKGQKDEHRNIHSCGNPTSLHFNPPDQSVAYEVPEEIVVQPNISAMIKVEMEEPEQRYDLLFESEEGSNHISRTKKKKADKRLQMRNNVQ